MQHPRGRVRRRRGAQGGGPGGVRDARDVRLNQTRDFVSSRKDTTQALNASLCVHVARAHHPARRRGRRAADTVREVFRTPLLSFPSRRVPQIVPRRPRRWTRFSPPDGEMEVDMEPRPTTPSSTTSSLHGRAGRAGERGQTLIGGTVTREAFFSRAAELLEEMARAARLDVRGGHERQALEAARRRRDAKKNEKSTLEIQVQPRERESNPPSDESPPGRTPLSS